MASLAKEFPQENLIGIDKSEYRRLRNALKQNLLLEFSKNAWISGDNAGWYMKSAEAPVRYLLVEHYESKDVGGLTVVYKVDKSMYDAFLQQSR